jgi:hypothetical protein
MGRVLDRACSFCGSYRHSTELCPHTWGGSAKRMTLRCSFCGSDRHNRDACPRAWPGPNPLERRD